MAGDKLTRADRERHAAFGIPADLLARAGVHRVTDQEARHASFTGAADLSGLVYPHLDLSGTTKQARLRRDVVLDGQAKYVAWQGRHHWAFPPDAATRAADTAITIVLVEAEKSMLTIEALATRTGRPLLPIALGGCWGWRGKIGKQTTASGKTAAERGPVPDFDLVTWTGRDVVLLFDANSAGNAKVEQARAKLAAHLRHLGAHVRIGTVPVGADVNGPDDYRAAHGDDALLALIDTAVPWSPADTPDDGDGGPKRSQASVLLDLADAAGAEPFATRDGEAFLAIPEGDHSTTVQTRSRACRSWLTKRYFDAKAAVPCAQALTDAQGVLEARALFGAPVVDVAVRVAGTPGTIYIDLGDPTWRAVQITAEGWRVIDRPPVRFRRPRGQYALPVPTRGGSLHLLRKYLNVATEHDYILIVAFLLASLRPTGPFPVLALTGPQGTGKSTCGRLLKILLDPGAAPLRSEPREGRDLMIAARQSSLLAFDNLSGLPSWLSDALCRLSTGGGFSTRALYSDNDEVVFDAVRPCILTGIADYISRGDLLDRAITVRLEPIADTARQLESTLMAAFTQDHPALLGALLDAAVVGLQRVDTLTLPRLPRLADFAQWAAACAPGCGWTAEAFLAAYGATQQAAIDGHLADDPLAQALLAVPRPWSGTSAELLTLVTSSVSDATKRGREWPQTPRGLSGHLARLEPLLATQGLQVTRDRRGRGRSRVLTLEENGNQPSQPSAPSFRPEFVDSCGHNADGCHSPVGQPSAASSAATSGFAPENAHADGADGADGSSPYSSMGGAYVVRV